VSCSRFNEEEKTWRLKSRALWLAAKDHNTNVFQIFANNRKSYNTILEFDDDWGSKVRVSTDLFSLGVNHFESIFKEHEHVNMGKVLQQISFFPHLVDDEGNWALYYEISKSKLLATISPFKRDKSPRSSVCNFF